MNLRARLLLIAACLSIAFLVWQWQRPYERGTDPAAGAVIDFVKIQRDESFFWLDVRLKITDPTRDNLSKPILLVLADGREKKPDSITQEGRPGLANEGDPAKLPELEALSLKFWLENSELAGPLSLKINEGSLSIREGGPIPELEQGGVQFHRTKNW